SRRWVCVSGYAYHALVPFVRAARDVLRLDAESVSRALAYEARIDARRVVPGRVSPSLLGIGRALARAERKALELERSVLRHERDAAQHYRWLVEMDLGILPDDALGTTLEECAAVQRSTRSLEITATLDLLEACAALTALVRRAPASIGDPLLADLIVPEPLELASVTPALALCSVAEAATRAQEKENGVPAQIRIADFAAGFGERGPDERELKSARFGERPELLLRLVSVLSERGVDSDDRRLEGARRERSASVEQLSRELGMVEARLLRALSLVARRLVLLRSRLHLVRARTLSMLRTAVLDVDRRLRRLIGSDPGAAFFFELGELLDSTVRPDPRLTRVAMERRHRWTEQMRAAPPPPLLGRGVRVRHETEPVAGLGLGTGEIVGRATVARTLEDALSLAPAPILVTRWLDASFAPLLPAVRAVVTDCGGVLDEGVLAARALGVPLVIGTERATQAFASGDLLRLELRAGSVTKA